jgi:ABC-2 type transport system permease protein
MWLVYAMQHLGDKEALEHSEEMLDKIAALEQSSKRLLLVVPSMHTQLLFNDLAGSSLGKHAQFLQATGAFHEKKKQ